MNALSPPLVIGKMVFDSGADPLTLAQLVQIAGGKWLASTGIPPTVAHVSPAMLKAAGVASGGWRGSWRCTRKRR